jgi:acyl carrier protein
MEQNEIIGMLKHTMKQSSHEKVDWDTVTAESTIDSLGFDSLSILDLVYDIQTTFHIEFEAEELVGIKTVGELATFLKSKMAK